MHVIFVFACKYPNIFCSARKKTHLVFVLDTKRPSISFPMLARKQTWFLIWIQEIQACRFQCSQKNRPDFWSGYKKSRHVVFNARKKTNQIFVLDARNPGILFSMLAKKRTWFLFLVQEIQACAIHIHLIIRIRSNNNLSLRNLLTCNLQQSPSAGMSTLSSSSCLTGKLVANASTGVRPRTRGSFSEPVMNVMTCRLPFMRWNSVSSCTKPSSCSQSSVTYHFVSFYHFSSCLSPKLLGKTCLTNRVSPVWGLGGDLQSACQCHILLNLFPSQLSHWPHCLLKRRVKDTCCQGELSNGSKCDMPCGEVTRTPCCGRNQRRKEQQHALWKNCANPIPNSKKLGTRKRARTRKTIPRGRQPSYFSFFLKCALQSTRLMHLNRVVNRSIPAYPNRTFSGMQSREDWMFPMCLNENGTHFLGLMAPKYIVAVFSHDLFDCN